MNKWSYLLQGSNKKYLPVIYKHLSEAGNECLGFFQEASDILNEVKGLKPDAIIIEVNEDFQTLKSILEELESMMCVAAFLVFEAIDDLTAETINNFKFVSFMTNPTQKDFFLQIFNTFLISSKKLMQSEKKTLEIDQENKKLSSMLSKKKLVEKAKWILADVKGLTEKQAYDYLFRMSRENRISMKEIAEEIIQLAESNKEIKLDVKYI